MSIHELTKQYTELLGQQCTQFQNGCPFRIVTTQGIPLITALESFTHNRRGEITPEMITAVQLSKELKLGTKEAHTRAESTHFVTEFIKGNVDEDVYALYTSQLYFIYESLEKRVEQLKHDALFKPLYFPELHRVMALKRDLNYFLGFEWREGIKPLKATMEYCKCIENSNAAELIAHHYTRFLGDLSGGQILKKKAQRHFELPESGLGVQFYEFDQIRNPMDFKKMYRRTLDGLRISPETANEIVQAANVSFNFNTDLFLELDEILGLQPKPIIQSPETERSECPFGFGETTRTTAATESEGSRSGFLSRSDKALAVFVLFLGIFGYLFWQYDF